VEYRVVSGDFAKTTVYVSLNIYVDSFGILSVFNRFLSQQAHSLVSGLSIFNLSDLS
jgi:hypothetical protein